MNRWLTVAVLVLLVLTGAMGLKALSGERSLMAVTSAPVPITPWAVTSAPVPITPWR